MNETNKIDTPADALILFVGHSDDASVEARAIYDLQPELQKELDALIDVMPSTPPPRFTKIKVWEWTYDAKPIKGGKRRR